VLQGDSSSINSTVAGQQQVSRVRSALYLRVSKPGRLCTGVIELNDLGIALLSAAEVVVQPIHGYGVGRVRLPTWQKDWRSNHLS